MASINLNRVVLTGNLTKDPELRTTTAGTTVCNLRIASNARRKTPSGEWTDKANYFDVVVWGAQGKNAARYLSRGRAVALDGRLDYREWQADDGTKHQAVQIIADTLQFLATPNGDPVAVQSHAGDEDIPF